MSAVDLADYIDLRLYDKLPSELVDRALADAAAKFPDWVPREGNTEVVLIEALALIGAELIYAINRVPGAVTEVLLRLFEITRDLGDPPTATVTFTLSDNLSHTIPAGTQVRLEIGGGLDPVDFTTNSDLVIANGATQGTVAVTGTSNTADANGIAAGTDLALITAVPYVDFVELATAVANGADPEDEAAWRNRGMARFRRLVTTLVHTQHFTAAALENADVDRATTIDNYDPGTGPNPGDNLGHVTVAVLGENGAVLSAARKLEIEADLEEDALAILDVHVIDPTITPVDVTVNVQNLDGYDNATVVANVQAALNAYLDPATWPFAATVRRNELIALIDGVEGVDYVDTLTAPAADVALPGVAPLADAGVLTVNVI